MKLHVQKSLPPMRFSKTLFLGKISFLADKPEAESDSDVPDTGSGGKRYARSALSRVFIHLDKLVKAVLRKSALEKLKKAGRVKEIAFTRNHSA